MTSPGRDDASHDGVAGILLHATGVGEMGLRERVLLAAYLVSICTGDTPLDGAKEKRTEVVDTPDWIGVVYQHDLFCRKHQIHHFGPTGTPRCQMCLA